MADLLADARNRSRSDAVQPSKHNQNVHRVERPAGGGLPAVLSCSSLAELSPSPGRVPPADEPYQQQSTFSGYGPATERKRSSSAWVPHVAWSGGDLNEVKQRLASAVDSQTASNDPGSFESYKHGRFGRGEDWHLAGLEPSCGVQVPLGLGASSPSFQSLDPDTTGAGMQPALPPNMRTMNQPLEGNRAPSLHDCGAQEGQKHQEHNDVGWQLGSPGIEAADRDRGQMYEQDFDRATASPHAAFAPFGRSSGDLSKYQSNRNSQPHLGQHAAAPSGMEGSGNQNGSSSDLLGRARNGRAPGSGRAPSGAPASHPAWRSVRLLRAVQEDVPLTGCRYAQCSYCMEHGIVHAATCCGAPRHTGCELQYQVQRCRGKLWKCDLIDAGGRVLLPCSMCKGGWETVKTSDMVQILHEYHKKPDTRVFPPPEAFEDDYRSDEDDDDEDSDFFLELGDSHVCSGEECGWFWESFGKTACWTCLFTVPVAAAVSYFIFAGTSLAEKDVIAAGASCTILITAVALLIGACAKRGMPRQGRCVRRANRCIAGALCGGCCCSASRGQPAAAASGGSDAGRKDYVDIEMGLKPDVPKDSSSGGGVRPSEGSFGSLRQLVYGDSKEAVPPLRTAAERSRLSSDAVEVRRLGVQRDVFGDRRLGVGPRDRAAVDSAGDLLRMPPPGVVLFSSGSGGSGRAAGDLGRPPRARENLRVGSSGASRAPAVGHQASAKDCSSPGATTMAQLQQLPLPLPLVPSLGSLEGGETPAVRAASDLDNQSNGSEVRAAMRRHGASAGTDGTDGWRSTRSPLAGLTPSRGVLGSSDSLPALDGGSAMMAMPSIVEGREGAVRPGGVVQARGTRMQSSSVLGAATRGMGGTAASGSEAVTASETWVNPLRQMRVTAFGAGQQAGTH